MKNVYKLGGPWETKSGTKYTVKAVEDVYPYLDDGWSLSLEDMPIEGVCEDVTEDKVEIVIPKKRNKIAKALDNGIDN